MKIDVFGWQELPVALGFLRSIGPKPSPAQDRFLEAIARLHRRKLDPRALFMPSLEQTAIVITDRERRKRLLELAVLMPMIDGAVEGARAATVAKVADALGVGERDALLLRDLAEHRRFATRLDLSRRILGRYVSEAWRDQGLAGVRKIVSSFIAVSRDPELAQRYRTLELLPRGSFGRALWDHFRLRHFAFPGEQGGVPERAVFHDLGHVLSGYDTDPSGEIQQAAFQSGFVKNDGMSFLFSGIIQFHLGIKLMPASEAAVGQLDVDKAMTALARGSACKVDLSDHWDYWPLLPRPLDEVREELGILPLAA